MFKLETSMPNNRKRLIIIYPHDNVLSHIHKNDVFKKYLLNEKCSYNEAVWKKAKPKTGGKIWEHYMF